MASQNLSRVALLTPNAPKQAVVDLRQAFTSLAKDEEFIAEAVEEAEIEEAPAEITAPPAEFLREEPAVAAFVAQTAEAVPPFVSPAIAPERRMSVPA